jgi:hypothetical protein
MSSMICAMMQPGRWTNFSDPNLDPNRPQHHPTQSDARRWGFPGNPLPSGHYPTRPNTLIPISLLEQNPAYGTALISMYANYAR